MVNHDLVPRPLSAEQSLAAVWRAAAGRLTRSGIVACVMFGALGVGSFVVSNRFPLLAALGVLLTTFGCYAAAVQPAIGGGLLSPRAQRMLTVALGAMAICAALVSGLLMLAIVFGGSIEVMRH